MLRDVERIAERSTARMQELLPSYARLPRHELTPVVLANARNLLEAIRDADADRSRAADVYRASGESRARQGITSDELLHGWRIGLEVIREEARAVSGAPDIGKDALLGFVDASLRWGDIAMRASASAHHEAEVRELGRLGREQAALRRVATIVARESTAEEVFAKVAEEVGLLLSVDGAAIQRYDPDAEATVVGNWGTMAQTIPVGSRLKLDGGSVTALVYRTQRPARFDDYEHAWGSVAVGAREVGLRCAVGSPIFVAGRLWGAIVAGTSAAEPMPADAESRIAHFTELVATAISNLQERAQVGRLADEQAALRRVATMVARESSSEDVFASVAEEVGQLLEAEGAMVYRFGRDGHAIVVGSWGNGFRVGGRWKLEGTGVIALVYRTQRPVRLDDREHGSGSIAEGARKPGMRSAVGSPVVVNERLWGAIAAAASRAGELPADAESRIAQFSELVATAISNIQERAEVERLAQEQAALRRVATLVARASPAAEVFAKVAEDVGLLLQVDAAAVWRYEPNGDGTVVGSWGDLGGTVPVGRRMKLDGDSVTALVYRTQRPARFDAYENTAGSVAAYARDVGLRSAVGSPIFVDGRLWGSLGAASTRVEPIPADAESRIAQFTELVATGIANVQARSDLAASRARIVAAADEERRRVVRDLHDGAQQRLVHAVVTLKLAGRALEEDREDAGALVSEALGHAQAANDELRDLAHGILPSVLTDGGLQAGVRSLASWMPIAVQTDISVERLADAVEATAYFVIAEALTNVAKHSQADHASVKACLERGALRLEVRDNGVGGAQADGTGLVGLRDRLAAVDGSLRVQSPAGGGTLIAASIPLPGLGSVQDRRPADSRTLNPSRLDTSPS